jgi:hypothetical protein
MPSTPHYDGMIVHKNFLGYFNFPLSLVENHEGKQNKMRWAFLKNKMPTESLLLER